MFYVKLAITPASTQILKVSLPDSSNSSIVSYSHFLFPLF